MNILFLSINVPEDGVRDRITYNFIWKEMKYLALKGHNVYYLSGLKQDKTEDGIFFISKAKLLESDTLIRRLKNLLFALKNLSFLYPLMINSVRRTLHICGVERACTKAIRKYNIDIIHTHFFEPEGEACVISAGRSGVPLVATLRGAELYNVPELDYGARRDPFYNIALQHSIPYINFFTAPNNNLCEKLRIEFNVPQNLISHIPNGVEKIFDKKRKSTMKEPTRFIAVGSMIKRKNFEIILDVIPSLPGFCEFFVVGTGPLEERYKSFVKERRIKSVVFFDEMPKPKLFKLMSRCDCLIHSSFLEGLPNVVLEALSIGLPCLVSDIPVHRELIIEGYNGFFFDPYNRDDLVSKIQYVLKERDLLARMTQNCIRSVAQYSIEAKIQQYIDIYKKLLQKC